MPPRCETCRWWTSLSESDDTGLWRWDESLAQLFGECRLARIQGNNPPTATRKAFAMDNEGYQAELITAPDFGCIQHEPKEDIAHAEHP